MTEKLDELHLGAWRTFITAHALLIDAIDRELAQAERVPLQWYDVLIELYEAPDRRLRMSELARKVVLTKSTVSRLVDRLENEGLLERQSTPTDGRGAFAVLTEKGERALREAWSVYARGIHTYFAQHLTDDEARAFIEMMQKMIDGASG
jgi:DNA-binding MarR family transcriptional regulator